MWKIVVVAGILLSVPVMSQEPFELELHRRFDAALARVDPAWREVGSQPRQATHPSTVRVWQRGRVILGIDHYPHETEHEAEQRARELVETIPVGFRPIDGYGDQAYVIGLRSGGEVRLIVRQGTTVLSIGSSDAATVMQVATEFLREIGRAQSEGIVR